MGVVWEDELAVMSAATLSQYILTQSWPRSHLGVASVGISHGWKGLVAKSF